MQNSSPEEQENGRIKPPALCFLANWTSIRVRTGLAGIAVIRVALGVCFHRENGYNEPSTGNRPVQCGKHNDDNAPPLELGPSISK